MPITCCRDERHPRPGTKRARDDDDHEEEEDLNESNFDEVGISGAIDAMCRDGMFT